MTLITNLASVNTHKYETRNSKVIALRVEH